MDYQPLDYSGAFSNLPDPAQSFTQGIQSGVSLQQAQMQQMQQRMQMARMQSMWQASQQVAQNPTLQNVSQLSIAFPEISEQLGRSFNMLQPAQQQAKLQTAIPVYAAAENGRYDVAANLLEQHAAALRNSGQTDEADSTQQMADMFRNNPGQAHTLAGLTLSAALGPDKFQSTFSALPAAQTGFGSVDANVQKAGAEANTASATAAAAPGKLAAETAQINSNIANQAGRLNLDYDTLRTQTQLKLQELQQQYGKPPDSVVPVINDAMTNAAASEQGANRYLDLANRIDAAGLGHGLAGSAADVFAKATGTENGAQALKQEYARIVNNQALSQVKDALGGRVTDTDMKVAMGPVPDPNSDPSVVSAYLRGNAKLMQLAAAQAQSKGEWLAQVGQAGSLGRAPKDITVMGTQVPAGSNYADFARQFIQDKATQIAAQSALAQAKNRSYMRFATPGSDAGVPTVPTVPTSPDVSPATPATAPLSPRTARDAGAVAAGQKQAQANADPQVIALRNQIANASGRSALALKAQLDGLLSSKYGL